MPDEVQEGRTLQMMEEWLNKNYRSQGWRAKSFYVANVES
jgi:hypothetical protein